MSYITKINRRDFLKGMIGVGGGLVLGIRPMPARAADTGQGPWATSVYLALAEDGIAIIVAHRSEMGTGIRTCLPAIVADELGADWARVKIEQAIGDAKYGSQNTDGSRSVRNFYDAMRDAGATARIMLERAAAQEWGVDVAGVSTSGHFVQHKASGKKVGFGDLVSKAAALPLPAKEELRYRSPETYRYIGKEFPIVDRQEITSGAAEFGMDVRLEGMKYAAIAHCPVVGDKVVSYDAKEALAVPGVEQVVALPDGRPPFAFHALGGLAVIASNTWAAFQGRDKLQIEWDYGDNASYDSNAYREELLETVNKAGEVVCLRGDVDPALAASAERHAADYYVPHLAHAPMEPPAAPWAR